jgi:serine/threonine protein kinase
MDVNDLPDRSGEVLKGKYRLESRLGIGGMAEVYRARNVMVDRTVAIKLLHREHASNRHVVDRFLQEARAANFVRHPNVVEVLDIDTDESGAPFIVQEYLEGEDLGSRLEKSGIALPFQTAVRMLLPVIKAIGVAHEKGLVHRDLKPENIFLSSQRGTTVPKVLDFGISKMPLKKGDSSLTITGAVLGSPAYMSPEQIQDSQSVDPRTDVWSLGVILYKTLTGQLPYSAESPAALFVKICTSDPEPLEKTRPGLPSGLNAIVSRCLKREPELRFKDANELYAEVSRVLEAAGTIVKEPVPPAPARAPSPPAPVRPPSPSPAAQAPHPVRPQPAAQSPPTQPGGAPAARKPSPFSSAAASPGEWGDFDSLGKSGPTPQKPVARPAPKAERAPAGQARAEKDRKEPSRLQRSSRRERGAGTQRKPRDRPGARAQPLALNRPPVVARASPAVPVHQMVRESQAASFEKSVLLNMVLAAALVIGISYLVRHLGPSAQDSAQTQLGSRAVVPLGIATLVLLAGSVQLGLQAMRASSLALLVADAGLFVVTGCAAISAWALASPGSSAASLPTAAASITWAGAAVSLGLAGFGLIKAKEGFRSDSTSGLAEAIVILVLSIGALVVGVSLGVDAMQGKKMPDVDMKIDRFKPGVINVE